MPVHNGGATSAGLADPHLRGNKSVSKQGTLGTMGIVSVTAHFLFLYLTIIDIFGLSILGCWTTLCIVGAVCGLSGFF